MKNELGKGGGKKNFIFLWCCCGFFKVKFVPFFYIYMLSHLYVTCYIYICRFPGKKGGGEIKK